MKHDQIINAVSKVTNVPIGALLSDDADLDLSISRSLLWFYQQRSGMTYTQIAAQVDGWKKTTIFKKVKRMDNWKSDPVKGVKRLMQAIETELSQTN